MIAAQRRALGALARTLFRWDVTLELDRVEARVVDRADAWLAQCPPARRDALLGALATFDEGFGAWAARPGTPFADGTPDEQRGWVEDCGHVRSKATHDAFEALCSVVLVHYVDP